MDWINLACDGDKWRDVVSTAMSLLVALNAENFVTR